MPTTLINYFKGRKLLIASMHAKEQAIAPAFSMLGVQCTVAPINTDVFGTFSGEVERTLSPIETAKAKAQWVIDTVEGADLVIASEGSFGPHPEIPFITVNTETLYLMDKQNNYERQYSELFYETNFAQQTVNTLSELEAFAKRIGFPSHGIILKAGNEIEKGITSSKGLVSAYNKLKNSSLDVVVETDMRANCNPTRMKNIAALACTFVELLQCLCPQCNTPGFAKTEAIKGLPCSNCGLPTNEAKANVYVCQTCNFTQEKEVEGILADPSVCNFCNP